MCDHIIYPKNCKNNHKTTKIVLYKKSHNNSPSIRRIFLIKIIYKIFLNKNKKWIMKNAIENE